MILQDLLVFTDVNSNHLYIKDNRENIIDAIEMLHNSINLHTDCVYNLHFEDNIARIYVNIDYNYSFNKITVSYDIKCTGELKFKNKVNPYIGFDKKLGIVLSTDLNLIDVIHEDIIFAYSDDMINKNLFKGRYCGNKIEKFIRLSDELDIFALSTRRDFNSIHYICRFDIKRCPKTLKCAAKMLDYHELKFPIGIEQDLETSIPLKIIDKHLYLKSHDFIIIICAETFVFVKSIENRYTILGEFEKNSWILWDKKYDYQILKIQGIDKITMEPTSKPVRDSTIIPIKFPESIISKFSNEIIKSLGGHLPSVLVDIVKHFYF